MDSTQEWEKKLDWISKSQLLNRTSRCIWKGSHLKGENQILFTSCDEYLKCNTIFQVLKVLRSISPRHVLYRRILTHFWTTKMSTDFTIILNEQGVVLNTKNFKPFCFFFELFWWNCASDAGTGGAGGATGPPNIFQII